jgi:hypothetical protein
MKAFHPIAGSTVQRTVTTTSANVAIPVGNTTTAVTLTDMLCPNPGTPFVYAEVFAINPTDTYMAAITDSGTCTVEFTFGYGV